MKRIGFLTAAFVGLATLSLTNAAHSAQSTQTKGGAIAPPQEAVNKKSDELAKRGVITPPQKTLNKKSDELAKRGLITQPQKTLNKNSDELAKRGLMTPPQVNKKNDEVAKRGIIIVSGKNKASAELNPQPLPPKAIITVGAKSSERMMNLQSQKTLSRQKSY